MSALPRMAPTIEQRRVLAADFAKRHPVRQYADNQPDMPVTVRAAGEACCAVADDDESELSMAALIGACLAGLSVWAAVFYATWWLVGLVFGEYA